MRLWTIHPRYLDTRGLVALWREGLLAKAVLEGKTRGYRNHPQLLRFRRHDTPSDAIIAYLRVVLAESLERDFHFDTRKIPVHGKTVDPMKVPRGQLEFEWKHLLKKLSLRDPERHLRFAGIKSPEPHPLFRVVDGDMNLCDWEVSRK